MFQSPLHRGKIRGSRFVRAWAPSSNCFSPLFIGEKFAGRHALVCAPARVPPSSLLFIGEKFAGATALVMNCPPCSFSPLFIGEKFAGGHIPPLFWADSNRPHRVRSRTRSCSKKSGGSRHARLRLLSATPFGTNWRRT